MLPQGMATSERSNFDAQADTYIYVVNQTAVSCTRLPFITRGTFLVRSFSLYSLSGWTIVLV
jgi:hypothetical protein